MTHKNILSTFSAYLALFVLMTFSVAAYASPAVVNLGTASTFAILSETGITDIPTAAITGNIGSSPITGAAIHVTCAEVTGTIYAADAAGPLPCAVNDATGLGIAVGDMGTAFADAAGRAPDATELGAGDISGMTLAPGVYKWSSGVLVNTDVTLSGTANDVWIFEISGDLTVASATHINLIGGALPKNIFWQVDGPIGATIGTTAVFNGNILSSKQVILNTGAVLNGRALAQTQVTLDQNTVTMPAAGFVCPSLSTYYVSTTGLDTNCGAIDTPFLTIQHAIGAASSGNTIDVAAGTYTESILVNKQVTILGTGATKPIVSGNASVNYIVKVNANGVSIDNFEINGGNTNAFSYGVFVTGAGTVGSPVIIQNSLVTNVHGGGSNGIGVESTSYVLVHDNTITAFDKNGIRFIQSNGKFYRNTVAGESVDGTSRVQNLVNLRGGSTVEIYTNALSNAITDPLVIPTWDSTGVLVSAYIDGVSVADAHANIHDNEISFSDTGIVITSVYAPVDGSSASITHNTIHNVNWAINFEKVSGSATVHNNSFTVVNAAVHAEGDSIVLSPGPVVNAGYNWWGTAVESGIQSLVYPEVNYSPWYLDSSMNTVSVTPSVTDTVFTSPDANVTIPAGTNITADASWNGIVNAPVIEPTANVTPTTAGFITHISSVVEVGTPGIKLTLDKATRIVMIGQTGKKVAYTFDGATVTTITTVCTDDTQATNDLLPAGGDCIFDNGVDMIIWTKHFTQFMTYTQTAAQSAVNLGTAGNFVILAKTGVSTTGVTLVTGNIGLSPAAASYITGFGLIADASNQFSTSSLVNGSIYAADYAPPTPTMMTTAIGDMQTAYTDAAGRTIPDYTELGAGNIGGMTLAPGLYKWSSAVTIPTDVTLNGSATDVWIFQVAQTLDIAPATKVLLIGGAQAKNVYWQAAGQTTLGTTSVFEGNVLDQTAIVFNSGATLNGRALAQTAVTLDASTVSTPTATVAVIDVTVPVITSFSLSSPSVFVGESLSANCIATDNSGQTPTTLVTGISTATAGTRTATCTATDAAGNSNTSTAVYTIFQQSRGGGGGGGSSSSSTTSGSSWPCGAWSTCGSDGTQTKICTQPNSDATSTQTQSCTPGSSTVVTPPVTQPTQPVQPTEPVAPVTPPEVTPPAAPGITGNVAGNGGTPVSGWWVAAGIIALIALATTAVVLTMRANKRNKK